MPGNEPRFTAEKAGIKSAEISLESVTQLFSAIDAYNQENSSEAIVRQAITAAITVSSPPDENPDNPNLLNRFTISRIVEEKLQKIEKGRGIHFQNQKELDALINNLRLQKTNQKYFLDSIYDHYESLLKQIGLSIETNNGLFAINLNNHLFKESKTESEIENNGFCIFIERIEFEESEIIYKISNGENFLSFLNSLDPRTPDSNFRNQLLKIIDNLASQQALPSKTEKDITSQLLFQNARFNTNSVLRFISQQRTKDNL